MWRLLTEGRDCGSGRAAAREDAKRALTRYRVTATRGGFSLVEAVIETGSKHRIRVHMAGLGCPIIGDAVYGARTNPAGRLGLHAHRLALTHPVIGRLVELESPLPPALQNVVRGNL